jgi:hypothetical protein
VKGDGATCDRCPAYAPFSVQDCMDDGGRITRWFACGRHLSRVLRESSGHWEADAVEVRYLPIDLAEQTL